MWKYRKHSFSCHEGHVLNIPKRLLAIKNAIKVGKGLVFFQLVFLFKWALKRWKSMNDYERADSQVGLLVMSGSGFGRCVPTFVARKAASNRLFVDIRERIVVSMRTSGPMFRRSGSHVGLATTKWTVTATVGLTTNRNGLRSGRGIDGRTRTVVGSVHVVVRSVKVLAEDEPLIKRSK